MRELSTTLAGRVLNCDGQAETNNMEIERRKRPSLAGCVVSLSSMMFPVSSTGAALAFHAKIVVHVLVQDLHCAES